MGGSPGWAMKQGFSEGAVGAGKESGLDVMGTVFPSPSAPRCTQHDKGVLSLLFCCFPLSTHLCSSLQDGHCFVPGCSSSNPLEEGCPGTGVPPAETLFLFLRAQAEFSFQEPDTFLRALLAMASFLPSLSPFLFPSPHSLHLPLSPSPALPSRTFLESPAQCPLFLGPEFPGKGPLQAGGPAPCASPCPRRPPRLSLPQMRTPPALFPVLKTSSCGSKCHQQGVGAGLTVLLSLRRRLGMGGGG